MGSVFGTKLKIELYGKSHGPNVGVRMHGVPEGLPFDTQKLQAFLTRRAPGKYPWSTPRKEDDVPRFLSGVRTTEDGELITDGEMIEAVIDNQDVRSRDYTSQISVPRPGHADYPAWVKYGMIEPGGGAFSARLTAPLCVAGGLCLQWLSANGICVRAHISLIGDITDAALTPDARVGDPFPVIDPEAGERMKALIDAAGRIGDSVGGTIECMITGLPAGIGSPVFGSMESRICQTVFAVPGVKGIEFGAGFAAGAMLGSENNDPYEITEDVVVTATNHHGGILGGLSSGMPVVFRTALKPTPSIGIEQDSVDLAAMEPVKLTVGGRHDPCIVPRAVPCIEAAAAIAICDMMLEEGRLAGRQENLNEDRNDLDQYRNDIDRIDADIATLLEKRLDVVRAVGTYKEAAGMPILDAAREEEKLQALEGLCSSDAWPYSSEVFRQIMAQSRKLQQERRTGGSVAYGLLGRKLGHSYSPQIHRLIGDYEFGLFDLEPEDLDAFFREGSFRGITVTMPYKKAVMKYCSELSETATKCVSVNTIVKRADGTYYGDNTDYYGFRSTVEGSGISVQDKKTIVLGSGGVSGTVIKVLEDLGASPIVVISRTGQDNYENLDRHGDARIVVNTTPVGMYPNAGKAVIDIRQFPACEAVFDLIYNPLRTKLMLDAADAGIPAFGGLHMLTAQAAKAYGLFCDADPQLGRAEDPDEVTRRACRQLRWQMENIVLIGMPGSGKTTFGRQLAEITGKTFVDCDEKITELYGRTPEEIIRQDGIEAFRDIETSVIGQTLRHDAATGTRAGTDTGGIIFAAGGGCVERDENRVPLLENSLVIYVERDLVELPVDGRPVSQTDGLQAVYERRHELYERWSDLKVVMK